MFQKNIFNSGNRVVSDLLSIVTSGTLYLQNKEADSHHHRYIRGTPRYDTWLLSSEKTLSAAGCSIVNSFLNTGMSNWGYLAAHVVF